MSVAIPDALAGETAQDRGLIYIEVLVREETARQRLQLENRKFFGELLTLSPAQKKTAVLALIDADLAERTAEIATFDAEAAAKKAEMVADQAFAQVVRNQVNAL